MCCIFDMLKDTSVGDKETIFVHLRRIGGEKAPTGVKEEQHKM